MSILRFILDLLFNLPKSKPSLISKVFGYFFLVLGGSMGMFFLFQALIPFIGYLESGMIVSVLLVLIGLGLLLIFPREKESSPEEMAEKALKYFKGLEIEKVIKNNALTLSLLFLGIGIALSQLKNIKKLMQVYNISK